MILKTNGVLQMYTAPSKLDVLFFDKVITLGPHSHYQMHDPKDEQIVADFEFLSNKGFIESVSTTLRELVTESESKGIDATHFAKRSAELRAWKSARPHWTGGREPRVDSPLPDFYADIARERVWSAESAMEARLFSILRSNATEIYAPILREDDDSLKPSRGVTLLQVALTAFPVPAEDVSLEELFDFKSSSTTARDYELFKRWLRTQVRDESLSPEVLQEELADLLSDHREHMRLANLKVREECLHTLLTAPAATVERLVKLQFSKLLDPFFELRKCRMQLLEAEAQSPGKEVAYLHKAKEALA